MTEIKDLKMALKVINDTLRQTEPLSYYLEVLHNGLPNNPI